STASPHTLPTRRSSDLVATGAADIVDDAGNIIQGAAAKYSTVDVGTNKGLMSKVIQTVGDFFNGIAQKVFKGKVTGKALTKIKRSEEHTSEFQSRFDLV